MRGQVSHWQSFDKAMLFQQTVHHFHIRCNDEHVQVECTVVIVDLAILLYTLLIIFTERLKKKMKNIAYERKRPMASNALRSKESKFSIIVSKEIINQNQSISDCKLFD